MRLLLLLALAGAFFASAVFSGWARAAQAVAYEPQIREIIAKDCARCHSGPLRNLMSYKAVKAYVDNGMLAAMLQGAMRQFAGPDADIILAWIDSGAPENPPRVRGQAAPAAFGAPGPPAGRPGPPSGAGGGGQQVQGDAPVTYAGGIEALLAKDCMRCHLGPFRKMTTYEEVKMYVDNGLLKTLVEPGGQMHRFAGPDTRIFLQWIEAGAPR